MTRLARMATWAKRGLTCRTHTSETSTKSSGREQPGGKGSRLFSFYAHGFVRSEGPTGFGTSSETSREVVELAVRLSRRTLQEKSRIHDPGIMWARAQRCCALTRGNRSAGWGCCDVGLLYN